MRNNDLEKGIPNISYMTSARNGKDQVPVSETMYINQTFLMMPSKQSQEYWLTHTNSSHRQSPSIYNGHRGFGLNVRVLKTIDFLWFQLSFE